jgi:hypothetical protein
MRPGRSPPRPAPGQDSNASANYSGSSEIATMQFSLTVTVAERAGPPTWRFVREFSYTVTEHETQRPWIVTGTSHGRVTLPDDTSFFVWARENWPAPRWTVELDPWQLSPDSSDGLQRPRHT